MLATALVLGLLLTYGPQDVLAFDSIKFSAIAQCGSFNISFSGGQAPPALPLSLTVIPFASTNIQKIPIPNTSWNAGSSSGAAITFLPFAAGTSFVASLDDGDGKSTGKVSDVIKIDPSSNTSCLPTGDKANTPAASFAVKGAVSQCEPFNVTFNPTTASSPSIRALIPRGSAFAINSTSTTSGVSSFIMDAGRGQEVVMLFDDGRGHKQSTDLITVGGDSKSNGTCIIERLKASTPSPVPQQTAAKTGLPKSTVLVIVAATLSTVGGISILMGLYIFYERRKRRLGKVRKFAPLNDPGGGDDGGENGEMPSMSSLSSLPQARLRVNMSASARPPPTTPGYVRGNTHYGTEGILPMRTPVTPSFISHRDRSNERSPPPGTLRPPVTLWPDQRPTGDPISERGSVDSIQEPSRSVHSRFSDRNELDIDEILDKATMYSQNASFNSTGPISAPAMRSRDPNRAPSNVPIGADRLSAFDNNGPPRASILDTPFSSRSRRISMESFVGGSMDSPSTDPTAPVQIATVSRAESAVAKVARMGTRNWDRRGTSSNDWI